MPNNYVQSYFDPSYRIEHRDGSQAERLKAAEKVKAYDDAYKQAAEQKAGRPLSQAELLRGVTPREVRSVQQRMADRDWRPKMTPRDGGKFDWMIEEAEKELRDQESNALTTEGYLNRLKGLRRKEDDIADAEAAEREWLADPFRAKALSELDSLSASMKFDTSRTESEHEAIRKARVSLQTVGADSVESRRLLRAVFENEDARKQAKIDAANARLADAQSALTNLRSGEQLPKVALPAGNTIGEKLHDLFNKVNAAGGSSRDLEVISEARESGDRKRQEWVIGQYADIPTPVEQTAIVVTEGAANE